MYLRLLCVSGWGHGWRKPYPILWDGSHPGDGATIYGWYSCLSADQWVAESSPKNFTHNSIALRHQNVRCTRCLPILFPISPFPHFPVCAARPAQPSHPLPPSIKTSQAFTLSPAAVRPANDSSIFLDSPFPLTCYYHHSSHSFCVIGLDTIQSSGQSVSAHKPNPCTSALLCHPQPHPLSSPPLPSSPTTEKPPLCSPWK